MKLSDPARDLYRQLTRAATFYVVDTEYTDRAAEDDITTPRIISVAVVPVVSGTVATGLYAEMNPTVAVSPATTRITGFTTETVCRKRRFDFYAPRIVSALAPQPGVFVSHTGVDLRAITGELERSQRDGGGWAPADLPDMPIIDTAQLARLLKVPGLPATQGTVSLADLCQVLGVNRNPGRAHNARYDARITAQVLLRLLEHAAAAEYTSLDQLLTAHARGTTGTPRQSPRYTSAPPTNPPLPTAHIDRHGLTNLPPSATGAQVSEFCSLAAECAANRCEHLADESLAVRQAAPRALEALWPLLAGCTEPGEAGTLLGAVRLLLPDALASRDTVRWWSKHKNDVSAAVRCGTDNDNACPDCRASRPCPIDVLYTTVATQAALCGKPNLTKQTVKYKLFSAEGKKDRRVRDWADSGHRDLAGYMAAMVVEWERDNGAATLAARYLDVACGSFTLHETEPRLALMWAEHLAATGKLPEAQKVAADLLAKRTTDDAFTALAAWADRVEQHLAVEARHAAEPVATVRPRLARPHGHRHPNRFRVYDEP